MFGLVFSLAATAAIVFGLVAASSFVLAAALFGLAFSFAAAFLVLGVSHFVVLILVLVLVVVSLWGLGFLLLLVPVSALVLGCVWVLDLD